MDEETCKDLSSELYPIERVFAIAELCANIISFLFPRQIRRLRLVSKKLNIACSPHLRITLLLNSSTPASIISESAFPRYLITSLSLDALDQVSPLYISLVKICPNISAIEIKDFGLDISFIEKTMEYLISPLRRLAIRSDGFATMESVVEAVLNSNAVKEIQILILEIVETGLFEIQVLDWYSFKSVLSKCSSLSELSLGGVKILDIPVHIDETSELSFPNITSLSLKQCDITSAGLITLLKVFPNLKSFEAICRDALFDIDYTNDERGIDFNQHWGVEFTSFCTYLRRVIVRCTNSRSNVDQRILYRFLAILPRIDTIELTGVGISSQRLQEITMEWSRRGVLLKRLQIDFNRRKTAEEDLEAMLRQDICSKLEVLDVWGGPDFLSRFWNQELQKSEIPFLLTLKSLQLRKNTEIFEERSGDKNILNITLRQMPKLVDLLIAAKLSDCAFIHEVDCEPDLHRDNDNWSDERPFLQSLAIGLNLEFYGNFRDLRQQIWKRFRFLESFRLLTDSV